MPQTFDIIEINDVGPQLALTAAEDQYILNHPNNSRKSISRVQLVGDAAWSYSVAPAGAAFAVPANVPIELEGITGLKVLYVKAVTTANLSARCTG